MLDEERYFMSASSLSDYEAGDTVPGHFRKAVSLSLLYAIPLRAMLELAGIGRWIVRSVGQRIRIQEWLHGGDGTLPGCQIRNAGQLCLRKPKSESLIREEKEGLVLKDWTAQSPPEIVLPFPLPSGAQECSCSH